MYGSFALQRTATHKLRTLALTIGVVAGLTGSALYAADAPSPMTVGGQFDVSPTGAATYSIPILVPPGTAGLAPSLSLNYSSQSGNGIVGFGWSVGGLPSITRCPRTYAQDSVHGSVNYNSDDRFCMDGQRLLVINNGTYGASNSEYRTEIDSFSRIIARGTQGNGPSYFTVYTKSGQILELGNPANGSNAQILAQGKTTVRVWAIDQISDHVGNYLRVFYVNDNPNGQYYPDHLVYTFNDTAGLSGYNSVYFSYGTPDRADITPLYHAGSVMKTTKLLSDIKTYTNPAGTGPAVTDYKLLYQLGNAPNSELTSVQRCDGSGACLPATTFNWTPAAPWAATLHNLPQTDPGKFWASIDLNGDGLEDATDDPLGQPFGGCEAMYLNTANGWTPANMMWSYTGTNGTVNKPACILEGTLIGSESFIDIDGDGLGDMDIHDLTVGCLCVGRNDGHGTFAQIGGSNSSIVDGHDIGPGPDLDDDGRADGAYFDYNSGNMTVYSGNGDATFKPAVTQYIGATGNDGTGRVSNTEDIDGDGCVDFMISSQSLNQIVPSPFCADPVPPITIPSYQTNGSNYSKLYWGDFNGDGNKDYVAVPYSGGSGTLNISSGTAFSATTETDFTDGSNVENQYFVGDFNGDGRADFLKVYVNGSNPSSSYFSIYSWQNGAFAKVLTVNAILPSPQCTDINCGDSREEGTVRLADVDGDGCTDIVVFQLVATPNSYYKFGCNAPQLMTGISNGLGATETITYDRLNQNTFYTKCTGQPGVYQCNNSYPTQAVDGPIYVVTRVDTSNGIGGNFSSTYAYSGAKKDLLGRGFLGFEQVAITDLQTNITKTTSYNMLFPYTGTVTEEKVAATGANGTVVLRDTINSYGIVPSAPVMGTPTFVYLDTTTTSGNEVDNTALPTATTSHGGASGYDAYGNPLSITTTVPGVSSKTTVNTWYNNSSTWIIGRLLTTTVTSVVGASTMTRNSSFNYNTANGVLISEIIEPGSSGGCLGNGSSCTLDTEYPVIDAFGHWTTRTVSGAGFATRTTTRTFDALGEFQTSETNPITTPGPQTEYFDYTGTYGPSFGVMTGHTDLNGLVTHWSYDSFGRRINETRPGANGGQTDVSYAYCAGVAGGTAVCPSYDSGAYVVQVTPYNHGHVAQNGPIAKSYYDALSRVIAADVQGYDGPLQTPCGTPCWIRADTSYDGSGYVHQTDRPYFVTGGTAKYTTYDYTVPVSGNQDPYGRTWKVTFPNASMTTNTYMGVGSAGAQTTVTNANSQTTTTIKNAQGLVASVKNTLGKTTSYVYDAYGDLLTVTDPLGNQIVNTYDIRGNKLTSDDPDMGHWIYIYDALGEILSQTDAKSLTTTLVYDALGRVTSRTEPDQISTWVYDTAANGVGMLMKATGSNASYNRTYQYDTQERPKKLKLSINGVTTYSYTPTYNSDSRIDTLTYPSGLVVKYLYTTLGYLNQLKDNTSGAVLWTANVHDAEMHLTDQSAGNHTHTISIFDANTGLVKQIRASASEGDDGGVAHFDYSFDAIGNLMNRSDLLTNYSETFCYDPLNRLINYSVDAYSGSNCLSGRSGLVKSATYNDIGNITNKSDLAGVGSGNFTYPGSGGGTGTRPHAVSSILGSVNGILNPSYKYDANGNMICEYTGLNCAGAGIIRDTETYWASNMPKTLTQGTTSVAFIYDSEHARITQAVTSGSSTVTKTYLNDPITGAMSEMVASGGTPTWNDYLMADGQLLGQRTCVGAAPCAGTTTTEYFVLDHLQSVAVVTDGATGAVTQRESFDAWGRQRNPDGSDDPTCALGASSPNKRRFTSQEHIDELCLINLNARIYDPTIGRFMVADSIIPDPLDGQSYNRYTYTDNRPLSFTDPTGHDFNEPWCIGSCINPNMTSTDGFTVQTTHMGDGSLKVEITLNSDGAQAVSHNRDGNGAGGVGKGVGISASHNSPASSERALSSEACNNTEPPGTGSGDHSQVETVVVMGERPPSVRVAAIGDFPPPPPGFDADTWLQDQVSTGRWRLTAPNGAKYILHPEDRGHWRHWDKQKPGSDDNDDGTSPPGSWKPRPGQKRAPYGDQSPVDPSGDAPGWKPSQFSPCGIVAGPGGCGSGTNYFIPGPLAPGSVAPFQIPYLGPVPEFVIP